MSLSSENLRPRFPFGDTPDPSSYCARGSWEPQSADGIEPSPQRLTHHPTTRRAPVSYPPEGSPVTLVALGLCSRCRLCLRHHDALTTFLPSSYTFKFSEQSLTVSYLT